MADDALIVEKVVSMAFDGDFFQFVLQDTRGGLHEILLTSEQAEAFSKKLDEGVAALNDGEYTVNLDRLEVSAITSGSRN